MAKFKFLDKNKNTHECILVSNTNQYGTLNDKIKICQYRGDKAIGSSVVGTNSVISISSDKSSVYYGDNTLPTIQFRGSNAVYNCFHSILYAKYIMPKDVVSNNILQKYIYLDSNSPRISKGTYSDAEATQLIDFMFGKSESYKSTNTGKVYASESMTLSIDGTNVSFKKGLNNISIVSSAVTKEEKELISLTLMYHVTTTTTTTYSLSCDSIKAAVCTTTTVAVQIETSSSSRIDVNSSTSSSVLKSVKIS